MKTIFLFLAIACSLTLGGWFLFGSNLGSVVDTAVSRTRSQMNLTLGEDFRLDQATVELDKADHEISKQKRRVAELRVSCEELEEEVRNMAATKASLQKRFRALDEAWTRSGNGRRTVAFGSKMVDAEDLRAELESTAVQIKNCHKRLEVRKQLLNTRLSARDQANVFLTEIKNRRDRVELAIETSRIDLESVRLLQQATGADVDATSLATAESIAKDVSHELHIQREVANLEIDSGIPASLMDTSGDDTVEEIRQLINNSTEVHTQKTKEVAYLH